MNDPLREWFPFLSRTSQTAFDGIPDENTDCLSMYTAYAASYDRASHCTGKMRQVLA